MSHILTLNRRNIVKNGFNNILRYDLPNSSVNFKNSEVAIHSINMYNSQFNIDSSAYQNNTFSIEVPTAATTSNIDINLISGYYSYTDINRMIQKALVSAGAYLIDAQGNNVFYVQISENATYYSAQVDLASVPTSLPVGYTRPATGLYSAGGSGLPTTGRVSRLIVSNAEFGKVIGFSSGTYPNAPTTTTQSFLSNITPQVNPVSSYMLRCSLIRNPFSIPSDVLTTFSTQGTTIGQLITYQPNEFSWVPIPDGPAASIQLIIVDQLERMPKFNDDNILISLIFRSKP